MLRKHPLLAAGLALILAAGLPACAPQQTAGTVSAGQMGRAASVSYGTIVGMRPVQVQGGTGGVGTAAGAVAGGVAGSFIGGDWRSNLLAGLGGAVLGGIAGNAAEGALGRGTAIEFVVREDRGGDIAVVQTNEAGLQVGDRVFISRSDRVRIARAADAGPQGGPMGGPMGGQQAPGAVQGGQPMSFHPGEGPAKR